MTTRADFRRFPFCWRNDCVSISRPLFWVVGLRLGCGSMSWIVLLSIPDKLIAVTLSFISICSSKRLISDLVGWLVISLPCVSWLCGVDKEICIRAWLNVWFCWVSYRN